MTGRHDDPPSADDAHAGELPPPGWYPAPDMADTRRYWDGSGWTDKVAPDDRDDELDLLLAQHLATSGGSSTLRIARGVALGIVVAVLGLWWLGSAASSNDDAECAIERAEAIATGKFAPSC